MPSHSMAARALSGAGFIIAAACSLGPLTPNARGATPSQAHDAERITVDDIVELQEFSGVAVCAEGGVIAARVNRPSLAQNKVVHEWIILDWPAGQRRFVIDGGAALNTLGYFENITAEWSPDCRWLYYRRAADEQVQVWRLNVETGVQQKATEDAADVQSFTLTVDGRGLIYQIGASRAEITSAEAQEYRDGVRVDETIFQWARLTENFPVYGKWRTVRRWSASAAGHLLSRWPPSIKYMAIEEGFARAASDAEQVALREKAAPGPDWLAVPHTDYKLDGSGDRAAISAPTQFHVGGRPIRFSLAVVARDTAAEPIECAHELCRAENLVILGWSEDGADIYFIAEQIRGAAGIYAWRPGTPEVRPIMETEGLLGALSSAKRSRSISCPVIDSYAICTFSDSRTPPALQAISLETGEARTLHAPNLQVQRKFALTTERIQWLDAFGRPAAGVLVYPKSFRAGERYPLVITTYTCRGFLAGGFADGAPEYVLAEQGFLVLCIDFNWDLPPADITARQSLGPGRYVAALSEFETAVEHLAQRGIADRDRVGVTGISFSSQSVSYALTHSTIFKAAALRSLGVHEPGNELFFRPGMKVAEELAKLHNIGPQGHDADSVYADIAVSMRADKVRAPILIQASDSEYLGSLPAFVALLKHQKPVELFAFPEETHVLHQPVHRATNFTRNVDWFRFWLEGYRDEDPAKEPQYKRWEHLETLNHNSPARPD